MLKEKNITVASAELKKQGTTNGKNWSIYKITDQNGLRYSTFEKQLSQIGISARVWYDEEQRDYQGKPYTARTIRRFEVGAEFQSPQVPSKPKEAPISDLEAILIEMQALTKRIEALEKEVNFEQPF